MSGSRLLTGGGAGLAGAALLVLLTGCGGSGEGPSAGTAEPVLSAGASSSPRGSEAASTPEGPATPGDITGIDLARFLELREEGRALVVDVRPGLFYSLGHIPEAISLPRKSFAATFAGQKGEFDAAVAAGKVLVLYCTDADCPDGYAVARELAARGYSATIYEGGWKEWQQAGR